jgi:dihydroorotase
MINLETAFAVVRTFCPQLPLEIVLEKIVINPRKILKLEIPQIAENSTANLTFFQPDKTWTYEEANGRSKSKNSPFLGKELKGEVFGIIHKGQFIRKEKQK